MFARVSASLLVAALTGFVVLPAAADGPADNLPDNVRPVPPKGDAVPDGVQAEIRKGLGELQELIKAAGDHPLLPDVLIYEKAVRWALDYNEVFDPKPAKGKTAPPPAGAVKKVLAAGLERAKQLKDGKTPWATQTGPVLRGYRSKIDGSVQPYWLIVPADYVAAAMTRHRLDFWWHGRGELLSEANFMVGSPGTGGINPVPGQFILHPYGRYCNANKFVGEVDTFECLEHVRKHYRIDDSRLVARGFSMGGAACWQFAVHYPTLWCANAPGAGFSETPEFLRVFQKEETKDVPWYEQKLWHLYNATDYAQNIFNLPTVAYSGEIDSQKQAADVMAREMKKVGLELDHVIGPKTGHSYEKGAKEVVNKKIDAIVAKGLPKTRDEIKFVTYTLRYNKCGPITVEGLVKHWDRASVSLKKVGDAAKPALSLTTNGVTAFQLRDSGYHPTGVEIDGVRVIDGMFSEGEGFSIGFRMVGGKWVGWNGDQTSLAKKPGLQGPIDDAFMDRFVMVRPTGKALNEKVGAWADAEMKHAVAHWRKHFRGDAPVADDKSITDEQIKNANLVLWGDPSSNAVLAKIADRLPVKWTSEGATVGDKTYPAGTHVPVLIYPNPLNPAKYVVLNSGFTFREYAYLNNARQVPMLPDYAVVDITTPPNSRHPGNVVRAGFFGERWELLPNAGRSPTLSNRLSMRRVLLVGAVLLIAGAAVAVWFITRPIPAPEGTNPDGTPSGPGRLVVVVVFDQFRGDYLARWAPHFGPDGFERLKREGVWYSDAHLPYACTSTGPGHATIATGAPPSVHGIIENDWYDRKAAARVYCAQPEREHARIPPLTVGGQPARGSGLGFGPDRVLVETLADRLQNATGGKGRVVVLSIKDRSVAMMAGKRPTAAYCFDTRDGVFHTGSNYRDAAHPWVEEFNKSGAVNRWVGKDWTRLRPDLDYDKLAGKDDAPGEGYGAKQGRVFPHPMGDEPTPGPRYYAAVETSPFGNELLLELAKKAITAEKLGRGEAADLLCLGFSSNDLVGHQWGPDSHEVLDMTLRSDRVVADLLGHLDAEVGKGRYAVVLTADHGICPIPEQKKLPHAERLSVNNLLPQLPAALDEVFGPAPSGLTRWLELDGRDAQQVWPWVYLNHQAIRARGADLQKVTDYAAQWLGNRHNSQLVAFTRRQIETGTLPPGTGPELRPLLEQVKLAYHPDRCGDIIVVPQPGVLVTGYPEGTSHGSPYPYDTHVPVLAAGLNIPGLGKQDRRASALLVAPITAKALGIDPPAGAVEKVGW